MDPKASKYLRATVFTSFDVKLITVLFGFHTLRSVVFSSPSKVTTEVTGWDSLSLTLVSFGDILDEHTNSLISKLPVDNICINFLYALFCFVFTSARMNQIIHMSVSL